MRIHNLARADSLTGEDSHLEVAQRTPSPREVLEELFELLEDYGPTWYTEEHHDRAVAALMSRKT